MTDLDERNAAAMLAYSKRVSAQMDELRAMVVKQNDKIASLVSEVASLKQKAVMGAVAARVAATGTGGTV